MYLFTENLPALNKKADSTFFTRFMAKKCIVFFSFSVIILILSEYFLLQEVFGAHRPAVIIASCIGTIFSILSIISFFKQYKRFSDDIES